MSRRPWSNAPAKTTEYDALSDVALTRFWSQRLYRQKRGNGSESTFVREFLQQADQSGLDKRADDPISLHECSGLFNTSLILRPQTCAQRASMSTRRSRSVSSLSSHRAAPSEYAGSRPNSDIREIHKALAHAQQRRIKAREEGLQELERDEVWKRWRRLDETRAVLLAARKVCKQDRSSTRNEIKKTMHAVQLNRMSAVASAEHAVSRVQRRMEARNNHTRRSTSSGPREEIAGTLRQAGQDDDAGHVNDDDDLYTRISQLESHLHTNSKRMQQVKVEMVQSKRALQHLQDKHPSAPGSQNFDWVCERASSDLSSSASTERALRGGFGQAGGFGGNTCRTQVRTRSASSSLSRSKGRATTPHKTLKAGDGAIDHELFLLKKLSGLWDTALPAASTNVIADKDGAVPDVQSMDRIVPTLRKPHRYAAGIQILHDESQISQLLLSPTSPGENANEGNELNARDAAVLDLLRKRNSQFLQCIDDAGLQALVDGMHYMKLSPGTVLMREGEKVTDVAIDSMYIIMSGQQPRLL